MRLAPVVDDVVLPRHPFDPDAPTLSAGVPLLTSVIATPLETVVSVTPR